MHKRSAGQSRETARPSADDQAAAPTPVSLKEVADQVGAVPDTWTIYVHRVTGEVVMVSDDAFDDVEEMRADRERVETSRDFVAMPSRFDLDEYRIMAGFAQTHPDPRISDSLCRAITGRGAFRRFKDTAHRLGVIEQWYAWRDRKVARVVADRLEAEGIPFVDDVTNDARR